MTTRPSSVGGTTGTSGKVGVSFDTKPKICDVPALRALKVEQKIDNDPIRERTLAMGPFLIGAFTTVDVAHGLGRPATGFIPALTSSDGRNTGGVGNLFNASSQLSAELQKTHIRVFNNSASPALCSFLVF